MDYDNIYQFKKTLIYFIVNILPQFFCFIYKSYVYLLKIFLFYKLDFSIKINTKKNKNNLVLF